MHQQKLSSKPLALRRWQRKNHGNEQTSLSLLVHSQQFWEEDKSCKLRSQVLKPEAQKTKVATEMSCYCSVTKSCLTLCNPMDCSTPGFPVLPCPSLSAGVYSSSHPLSDGIQPSHPLASPSPPALNLFQHRSLFQ